MATCSTHTDTQTQTTLAGLPACLPEKAQRTCRKFSQLVMQAGGTLIAAITSKDNGTYVNTNLRYEMSTATITTTS